MKPGMDRGLRRPIAGLLATLAVVAWPVEAQAPASLRVALVIGNSAYPAAPLANPINDARAMGLALKAQGFTVIEIHDATRARMEAAIGETRRLLEGKHGIGLLYYAGHGLQLDWRNYMVPVDARLTSAGDVAAQTVDVQAVLEAFRVSGNRMNILVLDACRDNPFAATGSSKGLAQMDAPPGTLLAYATAPGNVAEDGSTAGGNGLYTHFLVREIEQRESSIEDVFKRVRLQVRKQSEGRQIPWESTSLEEDFSFASGRRSVPGVDVARASAGLQAEKPEWERIKDSRAAADYFAFLAKYPNGAFAEQAQFRLDRLQTPLLTASPGRDGVAGPVPGAARYRKGDRFDYAVFDVYGKEMAPRRLTISEVGDDRVVVQGSKPSDIETWDLMGNLIADYNGRRNPAKIWFPAEISVGKHWRNAYEVTTSQGKGDVIWDFRVAALETITVPAGSFRAYRVEGTSPVSTGAYQTETYWIDASTFLMLRDDWLRRRANQIEDSYRRELVSYARAAG